MPFNSDLMLRHFILTQKSIQGEMPYDTIERIIHDSIERVKADNINAKITNFTLNVSNKLVLAQIYVERQNGFVPTKNNKFGTSPTAYRVQVRFPFGLETVLGQESVFLSTGDFHQILQPYHNGLKVVDDVQRDYKPNDIVNGSDAIELKIEPLAPANHQLTISCANEQIAYVFNMHQQIYEMGKGYTRIPYTQDLEYYTLEDYDCSFKMAGVYPLFYFSKNQHKGLLRYHAGYRGYTLEQNPQYVIENNNATQNSLRITKYNQYLDNVNAELIKTSLGSHWLEKITHCNQANAYLFDMTIVNGINLLSDTGLPVIRLRDYQVELFNKCLHFIEEVNQNKRRIANKINMGVGAGKTFFTYTLLQYLKQHPLSKLNPSYCFAPDKAVAGVTETLINRQGVMTNTRAIAITTKNQMPNPAFMKMYGLLSERAVCDTKIINEYLQHGLQTDILNSCLKRNIYPTKIINFLYDFYFGDDLINRCATYQDSMDPKRLLLLVEGQKLFVTKSGMLGIHALYNLHEQFLSIKKGLESDDSLLLIMDAKKANFNEVTHTVNYNRRVKLPTSVEKATSDRHINIAMITPAELNQILHLKYTSGRCNKLAIRDALMRIAFFKHNEAAILFANSGGLGNTYSNAQIEAQINRYLPFATDELKRLAKKTALNKHECYTLYLYLNEIFSTIPAELNSKKLLTKDDLYQLYYQTIVDNMALIDDVLLKIDNKIKSLTTVSQLENRAPREKSERDKSEPRPLGSVTHGATAFAQAEHQFPIDPNMKVVDAANQLIGFASLCITDTASDDGLELLLNHTHIFTPEGFAAFFEHLKQQEGRPLNQFKKEGGIYTVTQRGRVTPQAIANRLNQVLRSIMIADEIHKEEYKCFYDTEHSIYKRINAITQTYLKQPFNQLLPPRLGMSGTMNAVADKAFCGQTLFDLSTQKMLAQKLMKRVDIYTASLPSVICNKQQYAKQIVIDYFSQNQTEGQRDLFALSKGILFSKTPDNELNEYIRGYFNALLVSVDSSSIQAQRPATGSRDPEILLNVQTYCTETDRTGSSEQVNLHCQQTLSDGSDSKELYLKINQKRTTPLTADNLKYMHRKAFQSHLFAMYMEYILSKSTTPKEYSDIVGLQNQFYEEHGYFIALETIEIRSSDVKINLMLMSSVNSQCITKQDVQEFFQTRIQDAELCNKLVNLIMACKNDYRLFIKQIDSFTDTISLPTLITNDRATFESNKTLAMIGTANEATGYSHEPVGMIVDVPAVIGTMLQINQYVQQLKEGSFVEQDVGSLLLCMQRLIQNTYTYDEKNQMGGRALRTPYGRVGYFEYQTELNNFIKLAPQKNQPTLSALQVETSFDFIFTLDEAYAKEKRASISFNRAVFTLLTEESCSLITFYSNIFQHFAKELRSHDTCEQFKNYIDARLPLIWSIKHAPEKVLTYFTCYDDNIWSSIREETKGVTIPEIKSDDVVDEGGALDFTLPHGRDSVSSPPEAIVKTKNAAPFNQLLTQFQQKLLNLQQTSKYSAVYNRAFSAAKKLYSTLDDNGRSYFIEASITLDEFKTNCENAIQLASVELCKHRSVWGQLSLIIKGFLGILALLTVIPALVIEVASTHGFVGTFFRNHSTDSMQKLAPMELYLKNL